MMAVPLSWDRTGSTSRLRLGGRMKRVRRSGVFSATLDQQSGEIDLKRPPPGWKPQSRTFLTCEGGTGRTTLGYRADKARKNIDMNLCGLSNKFYIRIRRPGVIITRQTSADPRLLPCLVVMGSLSSHATTRAYVRAVTPSPLSCR